MPYPLFIDDSFPPRRNEPCFCASGRRFKNCCGKQSPGRAPPYGVGVVDQFLLPAECADLVRLADSVTGYRFTALDRSGDRILDPNRATEWVDFRQVAQRRLDDLIRRALQRHVIPKTGIDVEWFEQPELLRYGPGGYYKHHADAYHLVPEERVWKKVVDRDISMLIYLNEDYEGGELQFKRLFFTLRPRAGMLVWFPSDVRYEHMARPVISGRRYSLASWAAATGVERVQTERAKRSILWNESGG